MSGRRERGGRGESGTGSGERTRWCRRLLPALLPLVVACTDPRARPVAPLLDVQFAPSAVPTSPGTLLGSLYAFDEDGLALVQFSLVAADTLVIADTLQLLDGPIELTRPIRLAIPAGLAIGTPVRYAVRVRDFLDLATVDTTLLLIQTTP